MKARNFLPLGALGLILASCSSDEPTQNGGPINPNGDAYLAVNIEFPTTTGTRADSDYEYAEATEAEWAVNKAALYLWKESGNTEGSYTFVAKATLGNLDPWNSPEGDKENIDKVSQKHVFAIDGTLEKGNYYVLVVLNAPIGFSEPIEDMTYTQWAWTNGVNLSGSHFYMSNAAEYKDGTVTTLVPLTWDNVKTDESEVKEAAAEVTVQRGLAKITMTGAKVHKVNGGQYDGGEATITNWGLDNINTTGFPTLNTNSTTLNGVLGNSLFDGILWENRANFFNAMLWGVDVNYTGNTNLVSGEANYTPKEFVENSNVPVYCHENTCNLTAQASSKNLTRVVVKGTYKPAGFEKVESFIRLNNNAYTPENFLKYLQDVQKVNGYFKDMTLVESAPEDLVAGMFGKNGNLAKFFQNATEAEVSAALLELSETGDVEFYANGVNYYPVIIKHANTGWQSGPFATKDLGTYGVVRNNWYEINIDAVTGPGSSTFPEDEDLTTEHVYMMTTIKQMKWAKHTQGATLK